MLGSNVSNTLIAVVLLRLNWTNMVTLITDMNFEAEELRQKKRMLIIRTLRNHALNSYFFWMPKNSF